MITVVFTVEGQIGCETFDDTIKGKILARERFNALVHDLQVRDGVTDFLTGDKLGMFVNSVGCVQIVNTTPIRPWFKITRMTKPVTQKIDLAYGRLREVLGQQITATLGVLTERKKKSYITKGIHNICDQLIKKRST